MNPSPNESLQLPAPVNSEQLPPAAGGETPAGSTPEKTSASPEQRVGAAQAAVAAVPIAPLPGRANDPSAAQSDVSATSQVATPPVADDSDLIEKEWVTKAKQIVERTREDPYQQSEQLTAVKADYMKKRYNKTIKVDK